MKVINADGQIKIDANYIEIAVIVLVLEKYLIANDDNVVKELTYELQNPKIK